MKRFRALLCLVLAAALLLSSALAQEFKKGSKGDLVEAMQARLNALGYTVGTADGDYGAKTEAAVASFQADHGLSATGSVDEATWAALFDDSIELTWSEGRYSAEVKLVPPFTTISVSPDNPAMGYFTLEDIEYVVNVDPGCSMESNVTYMLEMLKSDYYEGNMVPNYQGSNYREEREDFTVNGDPACVVTVTVDFKTGGVNATQYTYLGFRELGDSYVDLALCYAVASISLLREEEAWITADTMREFISSIRYGTDDSMGAQDPWSWAAEHAPDLRLPYFELVEDGTTPMFLMAPISEYVNADTTDPGEGSVAMYYGAKLMNWYSMDLANGDTVDGAREKTRMFIKYSLDAKADPEGLWDQCSFCLACVKYAWENDSLMDLLTAMGAAPLGWTADDVEVMSQALMLGFDELMGSAVFSRETDEKILARLLQGAAVCIGFAGDSAPKASARYEGMLILPEGTVTVEANAFEGVAAESVIIPESCRSIGSCAFRNCPNLSIVGMPRDCDIADDAFEGCGLVTLYAPSGGTVEAYANSHPNCDFMGRDY